MIDVELKRVGDIVSVAKDRIQETHLKYALRVLIKKQLAGQFPKEDYETFIQTLTPTGRVKKTTRRNLSTLQSKYLPLPGRILFVAKDANRIADAFLEFLRNFNARAPVGERLQKNHPYKYASSLVYYFNGQPADLQKLAYYTRTGFDAEDVIEIINTAPHASTVESRAYRGGVMYKIAIDLASEYVPVCSIRYDYISSDVLGITYTKEKGGPSPETARKTGRKYPVVYALPRVAIGGPGTFPSRVVKPGNNRRRAARAKLGKPTGRGRSVRRF